MSKKPTQAELEIQQLTDKVAELDSLWKRALADYQNLEKRTRDQQQLMAQLACVTLIEKLLPVIDHLKLAAKHLHDPGIEMIIKQFTDVLASEGVIQIEAIHQDYDPSLMEGMEQVPGEANQVVEVVTEGYRIGDRILRPAKVKVGNGNNQK